ncbi:MAG: histidine kinase [Mycobacterium sp.]|nr:histidine kinase [Mycobacterium sp.]
MNTSRPTVVQRRLRLRPLLRARPRRPLGDDRRSLAVDVALAGGFAVAAGLAGGAHDGAFDAKAVSAAGWDLALAAPLVLCRRRPVAAVLLLGAVSFAQWLYGIPGIGDLAVLIALYVLGLRERRARVLAVLICGAQVGVVLATIRWHSDNVWLSEFMLSGTVTASWLLGVYTRTRRAYIASIRERAESAERDRDARAQFAVAVERARIAREMHDVVAHSISVMITLNDAAVAIGPPGRQREAIAQASEVGRQALDEMHLMLGVLRTGDRPAGDHAELAPQPGVGDLAALIAAVRSAGPEVRLTMEDGMDRVRATAQLAVYRIVQESLTNVLKHARRARHVTVDIQSTPSYIDITVRDDGVVAPANPAAPPLDEAVTGHGIAGMRERAALFGGRIEAGPRPGGGWQTRATLALSETASR